MSPTLLLRSGFQCFTALLLTILLASCDRPQKNEPPEITVTSVEESPAAAPESRATAEPPATPAATSERKKEEIAKPEPKPSAILDLRRVGDHLTLSGRLKSRYQLEDILVSLSGGNLTLDNQIEPDSELQGSDWGNRVSAVLPELAMSVPDLHFRIEEGIVTIEGTVPKEADKNRLQRSVAYHVESPQISELRNELKVAP